MCTCTLLVILFKLCFHKPKIPDILINNKFLASLCCIIPLAHASSVILSLGISPEIIQVPLIFLSSDFLSWWLVSGSHNFSSPPLPRKSLAKLPR